MMDVGRQEIYWKIIEYHISCEKWEKYIYIITSCCQPHKQLDTHSSNTYTHTHSHTYTHICICVCVRVCVCGEREWSDK